jgi:hypothetical protein
MARREDAMVGKVVVAVVEAAATGVGGNREIVIQIIATALTVTEADRQGIKARNQGMTKTLAQTMMMKTTILRIATLRMKRINLTPAPSKTKRKVNRILKMNFLPTTYQNLKFKVIS